MNFANGAAPDDRHYRLTDARRGLLPKASEGFAFAGLMSIMNLSDLCSSTVGAWLYEHLFDRAARAAPSSSPRRPRRRSRWSSFPLCFAWTAASVARAESGQMEPRAVPSEWEPARTGDAGCTGTCRPADSSRTECA